MKILVAEDDFVSQQILRRSLEIMGHEVIVTGNGALALQAYLDQPIDLIVSDWQMPEMDGLEFCRAVRSGKRRNYPYFILLTATFLGHENYAKAIGAGVDDFLLKPLDREAIAMRLHVGARIIKFSSEINRLQTLLPICMYCKKIRDDTNYWQTVEGYIREHTGTDFTHGICPDCYTNVVSPRLDKMEQELNSSVDSSEAVKHFDQPPAKG
jgi:phosphoserine phosphatase RsbU/P